MIVGLYVLDHQFWSELYKLRNAGYGISALMRCVFRFKHCYYSGEWDTYSKNKLKPVL